MARSVVVLAPEIAVSRWFNTDEPLTMALGAIIAAELAVSRR
jgi:hypothetical protein